MFMESEILDAEQLLRGVQNFETELAKTLKRCKQVIALAQQRQEGIRARQNAYLSYLQSLSTPQHTLPERPH